MLHLGWSKQQGRENNVTDRQLMRLLSGNQILVSIIGKMWKTVLEYAYWWLGETTQNTENVLSMCPVVGDFFFLSSRKLPTVTCAQSCSSQMIFFSLEQSWKRFCFMHNSVRVKLVDWFWRYFRKLPYWAVSTLSFSIFFFSYFHHVTVRFFFNFFNYVSWDPDLTSLLCT